MPLQSGMTLALSFIVILPFVAINQVVAKVTSSLIHNKSKVCRRWQGFRRHYDLITITQKSWPEYNPNHLVRKAEISAIQLEKKQKTCMACDLHLCKCIFGSTSVQQASQVVMLQESSCHQRGCKTAHKRTCHRSTVCYMQEHTKLWLNAESGCSVELTFVQATSTRTNPATAAQAPPQER